MPFNLCPECGTKIQESFLFCPICGKKLKEEKKEAEKRWITVIFTDIKGFTSLSETLDPEEVHRIVDNIFKELTEIIEKRGGYVDKYMGDAIMALFGAPKSYGDDAERALYSALEMQEVLKKNGIMARIGINSGFVLAGKIGKGREGDYTAIGDTVNTAQRIESVAEPGKIWVSENVYKELRDKFEFRPLGLFELKGKREKVKLFELLSPRRIEEEDFPFYNRDKEISLLEFLYSDIERGPFFVLITGEAGVGKTRLIKEFLKRGKINSIVLTPSPFSKEFLSEWEPLFKFSEKDFPAIRDSLSYIKELVKEKGFEEAKASLIYLFKRIFEKISEHYRIVVIEKLGFWDEFSRKMISEFVREIEKLPLIFIITERKKEPEFPEFENVIRIQLEPLEKEEFYKFLDLVFEKSFKQKDIFYSRTRGNFSFFKTLLNSLEEEEFVKKSNGKWIVLREFKEIDFPQSFLNLLQSWLDSLSDPAKTLVTIISFLGDEIPLEILKKLYETKERLMFEIALDEVLKKGILKESEDRRNIFRLSVPEIREIIREKTLKEERIKYHELIAETLSEIDKRDGFAHIIYRHYLSAGNINRAKYYLEKAIDKNIESYNLDEVSKLIEEYKKISSEDEFHFYNAKVLSLLKRSEEVLREIEKIKDENLKMRAIPYKTTAYNELGMHDENIKEINSVIDKIKEREIRLELLSNLAVSYYYKGELDKALEINVKLLSELNFKRDRILPKILNGMALIFNKFNKIDVSFECYDIAVIKAKEFNDKNQLAVLLVNMGYDYVNLKGDLESAEKCLKEALKIREELKDPVGLAGVYQGFAFLFSKKGNIEKALEFYLKARDVFAEIKRIRDLYVTEQNIANIFSNKCMFKEAEKYYRTSLERMEKFGNPYDLVLGRINYATMLLNLNKIEEAKKIFEDALQEAEKINFKLALSYIYANLSIIKFLKKEESFEEMMNRACENIKGSPIHEEYIKLRKAKLLYFKGEREKALELLNELEKKIPEMKDSRFKIEVMILKSFYLESNEKENLLLSLLKEARETGNDRLLIKILYLLKDSRKSTENLYIAFINRLFSSMTEEERKGFEKVILIT